MEIVAAASLIQLANHFRGTQVLSRPQPKIREVEATPLDLADIKGQESGKRALEVAAAGGHNLLLVGPPGAGKSMLAARLPSILPALTPEELLEVSMIASVAGEIEDGSLTNRRPFRSPHHSASMPALVGGGLRARPGEVSLAHRGVLFLDEFAEFQSQALDSLRQPLETGEVSIARANHRITYPARFMLVAAMNPCRCGRASDPGYICKRGANIRCAADYQAQAVRPAARPHRSACRDPGGHRRRPDPAAAVRRLGAKSPPASRARATFRRGATLRSASPQIAHQCAGVGPGAGTGRASPTIPGSALLRDAADAMRLSARGYHRVLRVARTLADLDGAEHVGRIHLAEALSYRALTDEMRRAA